MEPLVRGALETAMTHQPLRALVATAVSAVALALTCTAAQATPTPTVLSPWHTAGNGSYTDYGLGWFSVPNLGIWFSNRASLGSSASTGLMQIWALGFSDLHGISYAADEVADIFIAPVAGWGDGVSLGGFDLGSWGGEAITSDVRVYNGDYSQLLYSGEASSAALHASVALELFSTNGFHIQFDARTRPGGWVGIDNLVLAAGDLWPGTAGAVAAPGTLSLGLTALAAAAALRGRRPRPATQAAA